VEKHKVRCDDCGAIFTEIYPDGLYGDESYSDPDDPKPCDCESQYTIIDGGEVASKRGRKSTVQDAITPTTTFESEHFVRTALVVSNDADPGREAGSVDVVRIVGGKVERLAQINIFYIAKSVDQTVTCEDHLHVSDPECEVCAEELEQAEGQEVLMVDVIDVDKRYTTRRALVFASRERKSIDVPKGGILVATHFARSAGKKEKK